MERIIIALQEIVRRLEGLSALADQLEARLAKAHGQVEKFTPSRLHGAVSTLGAMAVALLLVPQPMGAASVRPVADSVTYPDGRPSAQYRLAARDAGPVLSHGSGPGHCDDLGARDVWVWEHGGSYFMHYDGAGTNGWLACLATSQDLTNWIKKGPVLDLGSPGSRGWIIESNVISHSICSGIALGKHGDQYDNTSADTAEGYVKTIERAHAFAIPWTRENIGHHVVRNNTISHCEQAGIVGSLGAAFSTITGNTIHDIHVRRLFTGAEMAGIKFHAAIDTTIRGNHIYRTCLGLWLDWMAQGTRVSGNLFHDNAGQDLFVEVNHGPFVVDNNLFLSPTSLLDMSEGGAYAHNLFAGKITNRPEPSRQTPHHPAHSTTVAGLASIQGGDDRFLNNIFVGDGGQMIEARKGNLRELRWISSYGLWGYDGRDLPLQTGGNVYYWGAQPYCQEVGGVVLADRTPELKLREQGDRFLLQLDLGPELKHTSTTSVATSRLGQARTPGLPYENADGSPLKIDRDYFGRKRSAAHPTPGPFENPVAGLRSVEVW